LTSWKWQKTSGGAVVGTFDRGWVSGHAEIYKVPTTTEVAVVVDVAFPARKEAVDASLRVRVGAYSEDGLKRLAEQRAEDVIRKTLLATLDEKAPIAAASVDNFAVLLKQMAADPTTPGHLTRLNQLPGMTAAQFRLLRAGDLKGLALKLAGKAIWRALRLALVRVRKVPPLTPDTEVRKSPAHGG